MSTPDGSESSVGALLAEQLATETVEMTVGHEPLTVYGGSTQGDVLAASWARSRTSV